MSLHHQFHHVVLWDAKEKATHPWQAKRTRYERWAMTEKELLSWDAHGNTHTHYAARQWDDYETEGARYFFRQLGPGKVQRVTILRDWTGTLHGSVHNSVPATCSILVPAQSGPWEKVAMWEE